MIDDSGSVFGWPDAAKPKAQLIAGFTKFLEICNPGNEYFTFVFNSTSSRAENWTTDRIAITNALANTTGKGQTPLYDALSKAITKVTTGKYRKHVLILISDGQDSASKTTFSQLRDQIKNSDVVLYCVVLLDGQQVGSSLAMEGVDVLDELANSTGGQALAPVPNKNIGYSELVLAIASELLNQYRVVIVPDAPSPNKGWRRINVKVTAPEEGAKKKITVRSRKAFR